jgi:asparagine synthase (glutamine-hydrolysing)
MQNEDSTVWITLNGEIYNFQSLRKQLIALGRHTFRTTSDTEVLLHLYEACGSEEIVTYLNRLRGMFAFGLWDSKQRKLLLARDPVGKKPLFYAKTSDGLIFASTIQSLFQERSIPRQMNWSAIQLYLRLGYIPAPLTGFQGIFKLQAGHYLIANARGLLKTEPYWTPNFEPKLKVSGRDLQHMIIEKLAEATRLRMISDVPLGAFLSGGIDSSAVVAMMSRQSSLPVRTFSVSFSGSPLDESAHARFVAQRFGCDHTELTVKMQPKCLLELVRHFEEPFAEFSAIPTYYMSQVARQYVKVVLNGDGGDENFAGYILRHRAYRTAESLPLPAFVQKALLILANMLPMWAESSSPHRLRKSLRILGEKGWRRNLALMEVFSPHDLFRLSGKVNKKPYRDAIFQPLHAIWQEACKIRGLDRELYFSFALHLPEQLLVKVDRASMAFGLETRSPLLDREFIEFCAKIPAQDKLNGNRGKYVFKQALQGILPEEILTRPKQGFIPPLGEWLKCELRELVEDCLLSQESFVGNHLRRKAVNQLVRQHLEGDRDHQRRLYTLLFLEMWERHFIRGRSL